MKRTYTTKSGDMWDSIAWSILGSENQMTELMRRNRRYLKFYIFPAGITLALPPQSSTPAASNALPPWKETLG